MVGEDDRRGVEPRSVEASLSTLPSARGCLACQRPHVRPRGPPEKSLAIPAYDAAVRRNAAAVGTAIFLILVPGTTAGLVPWLLTRWRVRDPPPHPAIRLVGLVLVVVGSIVLIGAFVRFVTEGRGTPAPIAPTERLVVGGLYRYVRNPMYLAVAATIVGQALFLGRLVLLAYAGLFFGTTAAFVYWYEEPMLLQRYGSQYETYRRAVPRWWPRWRPWEPDNRSTT